MQSPITLCNVVLASASPRRLELLLGLGLAVEVRPSGYHEPDQPEATPLELAISHARNKALHVNDADGLVVAADTVVDLDGLALNKPVDAADAARMLRSLAGREHRVHTAFALRVPGRNGLIEEHST